MTHRDEGKIIRELCEVLIASGLEGASDVMKALL